MTDWQDEDDDCKAAFVSVYGAEPGGRSFGGGIMVWDRRVVTAAHVVNQALGRSDGADFAKDERAVVRVGFPGSAAEPCEAVVIGWVPRKDAEGSSPLRAGSQTWAGDLALLKVLGPVPATARPVRLDHHRLDGTVYAWYGSGESTTTVSARVVSESGPWITVDTTGSALKLVPGYSGGPLWDRRRRAVVGMVIGVDGDRGYAMPLREIMKHLAGRQHLLGGLDAAAADSPAVESLRAILGRFLGRLDASGRAEAERTARRLGCYEPLTGADEAVEELVAAALSVRRGVPTLAAALCALTADPEARRKLSAAAMRVSGELLSAGEYGQLSRLLALLPAGGLYRAASRALPDSHSLPVADGPLAVLEALERLAWPPGSVPSLVRVVEFVAADAARDEDREALREWDEQIVERIGTDAAKLAERRVEAEEWAARRDRGIRVQVRLERVDARTFRHRIWFGRDGEHHNICTEDTPLSRPQILACLEDVLTREVPDDAESVLLEFFVDEDELDLDVDRWTISGAVPRMLGAEYEVVLRCLKPRLAVKTRWRHSWTRLGRDDPYVLGADLTSASAVYAALKSTDVACVVAFPEDQHRMAVVIGCVYAGVPAVLSPRRDQLAAARDQLLGICAPDGQSALPASVRRLRARAVGDSDGPGGHLTLVWDDPKQYPRELTLTVPRQEG
jgi:hypothetical protein